MPRIEWTAPNPTPLRHWLTTCDSNGCCDSDVSAADIVAWLRAAPDAVRAEVLGALVIRVSDADMARVVEDLRARAERAEERLRRDRGATVTRWKRERDEANTRAEKAEAEVERLRKDRGATVRERDAATIRAGVAEAELVVCGDATGKWRARAEKAEADLKAAHAALDGSIGRHPDGNVLEPPMTLAERIGAYREWARLAITDNRAASRNAIRKALDWAWYRGYAAAREQIPELQPGRFDPSGSYGTDDLIPDEFR